MRTCQVCVLICVSCLGVLRAEGNLGIQVPEGFHVSLYADDDLAHNIYSMTVDPRGRVAVSGPGYIKILHDDNGDGRADRATLFSDKPASGAQGLCFDGPRLLCVGDKSLMLLEDPDGDDHADGPPTIWSEPLGHTEHGAHGIVKGPDGWFYCMCGNDAGVSKQHVKTPNSPVKDPRCGAVVRFSPDGKLSEVVAHGFRNPYDLDFNAYGQLFTVDADGERDHNLPWYAPTRLFDIAPGMEHGWLLQGWQGSWNRPESFFDNVPRLAEMGRGSPTGLVVYRHRQFPEQYRGGVFSACWTFGRVYYLPLKRSGSSYKSHPETFLQTQGEVGFAPADLAVGPAGELYIAIGGRGTRGGVFRVTYGDGQAPPSVGDDPLQQVLAADQPLSSWSRAKWEPLAHQLGAKAFEAAALDKTRPTVQRIRAVEVLCEVFDGLSLDIANTLKSSDPELTARVAWCIARQKATSDNFTTFLADLTTHDSLIVQRQAWESLITSTSVPGRLESGRAMASDDRHVHEAVHLARSRSLSFSGAHRGDPAITLRIVISSIRWSIATTAGLSEHIRERVRLEKQWPDLKHRLLASNDRQGWLEAIRLIQVEHGDLRATGAQPEVYSGYSSSDIDRVPKATRDDIATTLASKFPMPDAEINRELGRLFAILEADHPELPERITRQWTDESSPQDDIHYLIILSRLPGARSPEVTQRTAHALARLHHKLAARRLFASRNLPLRVGETFEQLVHRDGALPAALVSDPAFGLSEHSLFAALMKGADQQAAAAKLLQRAQGSEAENAWTSELITVLGALPDEQSLPVLREHWSNLGLRDAIVPILARSPEAVDRSRFLEGLASMQSDVVAVAAGALVQLRDTGKPEEIALAVKALRAQCAVKQQRPARRALVKLLEQWSDRKFAIEEADNLLASYQPCFDWFSTAHPAQAASLRGLQGADAAAWQRRLGSVDWTDSDAARGKLVYEKKACHRCHTGGGKLGPDLAGAANRLSREDLFASILDPSKEISPLYKTTLIATRSGKVHHGLLIYDSPDGMLLQTSPDTTLRITGEDILQVEASRQSLMPTGLLNDVSDRDLADLYAYLKTLRPN